MRIPTGDLFDVTLVIENTDGPDDSDDHDEEEMKKMKKMNDTFCRALYILFWQNVAIYALCCFLLRDARVHKNG